MYSQPIPGGDDVHNRKRSREMDIAESHYLLLELGTQEPVMQHCLKTLQGMCLAQGVRLAKKGAHDQDPSTKQWSSQATDEFQRHIDKHWVPFCEEAIRMFYVCGFVPWHVRRLRSTGDLVPEVIPLGTFTWHTELRMEKEKRRRNDDASSRFHRAHASYVPAIVDERNDRRGRGHWGVEWHNPPPKRIKKKGEDEEDDEEEKDKDEEEKAGTKREVAASVRRGDQVQDNRGAGGTSGVHGLTSVEVGHPVGSRSVRMDGENKYVQYRLRINDGGLTEEEVYIYDFVPAKFDICTNSMMYATVVSPLAHVLVDYKNLRQAQIRRSHADAWNTQAHMITTHKPGSTSNNVPEWKGFNYGAGDMDTRTPTADGVNPISLLFDTNGQSEVLGRDCLVRRNVLQGRPHDPVVYTLPKNSELVQPVELKPVEDVPLLLEKYSRDVAFVLGIPPSYVVSKASLSSSTSSSQQCENSNTCSTNAQAVCRHLESLLSDVHEVVYGGPAEFAIVPMPRVSIDTMDDIKNLMDSGLMLPERAVQLVDTLLRSQNLPESGEEGGKHARRVQKLILEKPSAEGSSSSKKKK